MTVVAVGLAQGSGEELEEQVDETALVEEHTVVVGGAGATALPEPLAREAELLGANVLPFAPGLVRPVSVVYARSGLSPAAKALLDEIVPAG